jgi:hypothetical protein
MIIVVARYKETVNWTEQFPNVIIYNKGQKLPVGYNEVLLKNVGREGHTYYKYICDNYDNLDDYTIFLQGHPFDHSPNLIYNLNKYANDKNLLIDFEFLSEDIHVSTIELQCAEYIECANLRTDFTRIFGTKCEDQECVFGAGAQFIVSKTKILQKSKDFYANIVKMLEYCKNPKEGYNIERLHKYIFM